MTKQITFIENDKIRFSVYFSCKTEEEFILVKEFFEKLCRLVSHIGYDVSIDVSNTKE